MCAGKLKSTQQCTRRTGLSGTWVATHTKYSEVPTVHPQVTVPSTSQDDHQALEK